ncbi:MULTISPECIES: division/cell wall cluster transcriptional repressor MraZ [Saccharibacillus]|uniref:Transcriptional regulator MraZ n=1 Tax=Saccharibacillus brassicae TaxID=2583377 RepID=A0A4Y6V0R7_SACBS|nr:MULTISPECIES: division/cell wall cluster transcriptional repressor MraZ [Saccharibacillus]MWJ32242.1 division/cell wall cluster transcriptional repressor MraZ [Saccharibacillus sp. WB 17]QDH23629.1 division/cell wall cluster transcriptional repressor MraZ [Saccharibacillus brassicae]
MFMGEYRHNIDDKGRLIVPARFREKLGLRCIVTRGLDQCLFVYSEQEWELLERKLNNLPLMKSDARAFTRFFFSGAAECEWDKQGRANLPANLREYAQLDKECVVIGAGSRVEIWSRDNWDRYYKRSEESFGEIAEKLSDFDIDF